MSPKMIMPRRGGSPEAASKANFQLQVYTIKRLLQGVMLAAFLGESLAFAVVVGLAVFAMGGA